MTPDEIHLGHVIRWDPKFNIGIPDNKEFGGSWEDEFKYAIRECFEYVKVHFRSEEILMQAAGFHGLPEHKEVHALFIKKVLKYSSIERYSIGDAFELVRFLYEWILSHIAHDDKLFVKSVIRYMEQRNSCGSSIEKI